LTLRNINKLATVLPVMATLLNHSSSDGKYIEMPMRSEKALREAALNIAQYLPDDDDAPKICELALQAVRWRDRGEPLDAVPGPKLVVD
jgi:hypothetical protein